MSPRTLPRPITWKFEDSCIRCTSHVPDGSGYVLIRRRGSKRSLCRIILERRLQRTPEVARHTCDNRWCVNPDHILDGTPADNVRDRESRGRGVRNPPFGVVHWNARLTEDEVMSIRNSELPKSSLRSIYGVNYSTIWRIQNHQRRKRG
jgi:hypothetical protein